MDGQGGAVIWRSPPGLSWTGGAWMGGDRLRRILAELPAGEEAGPRLGCAR